ncbi:MAG: SGNH/GDSL hydrolase family protein [Actinomycetota bacterium]
MADDTTATDSTTPDVPDWLLGAVWTGSHLAAVISSWIALNQPAFVLGMFLILLAAALGMIGVFAALRLVAQRGVGRLDGRALRLTAAYGAASAHVAVGGIGLTLAGYAIENQPVTAFGALLAIHGTAFALDFMNQRVGEGSDRYKTAFVVLSLDVIVASLLALSFMEDFGAGVATGVLGYLLGLVLLKLSIIQFAEAGRWRRLMTWTGTIGVLALSVVVGFVGGRVALIWAAGGVLTSLSVLGLLLHNAVALPESLTGKPIFGAIDPHTQDEQRRTEALLSPRHAIAAGVILGMIGLMLTSRLTESAAAPIGVAVVIMLIGLFFVLPGELVFATVMIGLLVTWVAHDTDAADPNEFNDETALLAVGGQGTAQSDSAVPQPVSWLVALGDSYISGEGADDFFAGTNSPGSNDCRRAPTAYPQLVGRELGMSVLSFACSGAETKHLLSEPQKSDPTVIGSRPQLDAFESWLTSEQPDLGIVLLSIGGNDSGFSDVINACLTPSANCADAERPFVERLGELATPLNAVYTRLLDVLHEADLPNGMPTILVSQYPDPLGDEGVDCNLTLGEDEGDFIRRFRAGLNLQVTSAVKTFNTERGTELLLPRTGDAAAGHAICNDERFINWIQLLPTDGPIWNSINPLLWKNGSMHPNEGGHCAMAWLVLESIDPGYTPTGLPCSEPQGSSPGLTTGGKEQRPGICDGDEPLLGKACTDRWTSAALSGSVQGVLWAGSVLLVAGMMFAIALTSYSIGEKALRRSSTLHVLWVAAFGSWIDYDKVANGYRSMSKRDRSLSTRASS